MMYVYLHDVAIFSEFFEFSDLQKEWENPQ